MSYVGIPSSSPPSYLALMVRVPVPSIQRRRLDKFMESWGKGEFILRGAALYRPTKFLQTPNAHMLNVGMSCFHISRTAPTETPTGYHSQLGLLNTKDSDSWWSVNSCRITYRIPLTSRLLLIHKTFYWWKILTPGRVTPCRITCRAPLTTLLLLYTKDSTDESFWLLSKG